MRIAQVAPLYESVPPKLYGGTERVVSYLTEALVQQGHDVTLFASGDSITQAQLVSICPRALRLDPDCQDSLAHHIVLMEEVFSRAYDFDIVHFHIDYLHFPLSSRYGVGHLTTLHGRLDLPDLQPVYARFPDTPVVSISDSQRAPLALANWLATVYHGLPTNLLRLEEHPEKYLAFLGRISPEKRADRAIEIAIRSGMRIKIAAKVDRVDREYFESRIRPLLDHPLVEFVGEINEQQKQDFLGNALALIFPIDWPEPFGLAMIESMACGTPVIAFRRGSIPEVVDEGVTGMIVDHVEAAVSAVNQLRHISRKECRARFEKRFSAKRMALDYVKVYESILRESEGREAVERTVEPRGVQVV
jgi:glycosyltransferase involved in cell wall biosynthesis